VDPSKNTLQLYITLKTFSNEEKKNYSKSLTNIPIISQRWLNSIKLVFLICLKLNHRKKWCIEVVEPTLFQGVDANGRFQIPMEKMKRLEN